MSMKLKLKAPVYYGIGLSSHDGVVWTYSPTLLRLSAWVRRRVARVILPEIPGSPTLSWGNRLEDVSRRLFGEWFHGSGDPRFPWIRWAIAVRHAVLSSPAPRSRKEGRAAKVA